MLYHKIENIKGTKNLYIIKTCEQILYCTNFDQTKWFSLSYFGPDPEFYPQFQTLQVLHSTLKAWWVQLPKKMLLGCVLLKVYSLMGGGSLKAYSLYTVHISFYISLFQIRNYSSIAYDNPF